MRDEDADVYPVPVFADDQDDREFRLLLETVVVIAKAEVEIRDLLRGPVERFPGDA